MWNRIQPAVHDQIIELALEHLTACDGDHGRGRLARRVRGDDVPLGGANDRLRRAGLQCDHLLALGHTAEIPEKPEKDAGLGPTLPLYAFGLASIGWWAIFITMISDGTAFGSLVFSYFFYWTIHSDFTRVSPVRVMSGR